MYARHFTLITDHKPLVTLFAPNKAIPEITANCLQRRALILQNFSYSIEYVPSHRNNADCFSCFPSKREFTERLDDISYVNFVMENRGETSKDKILGKIIEFVKYGWPKKVRAEYKQFSCFKSNLSYEKGCLMLGYRVVVPNSLQTRILKELHSTHQGIVKMKSVTRPYVWWPNLNSEIEQILWKLLTSM